MGRKTSSTGQPNWPIVCVIRPRNLLLQGQPYPIEHFYDNPVDIRTIINRIMDTSIAIAAIVRPELLHLDGVIKFAPNRRFTTLYSEGSPADSILFPDSGLGKICKPGEEGKEIILQLISSGAR